MWIKNTGSGVRPDSLCENDLVEVQYRDGTQTVRCAGEPLLWLNLGSFSDVVAWRKKSLKPVSNIHKE